MTRSRSAQLKADREFSRLMKETLDQTASVPNDEDNHEREDSE